MKKAQQKTEVQAQNEQAASDVMPKLLAEVYQEVKTALSEVCGLEMQTAEKTIRAWYTVGDLVDKVKTDSRRYGERAIPQLAARLSKELGREIRDSDLWVACNVVNVYPELPYIEELIRRAKANNHTFTYTHLRVLASNDLKLEANEEKRRAWEDQIVEKGLSVASLLAELRKDKPKQRRPSSVPKTPEIACQQIMKFFSLLEEKQSLWEEGLFAAIANADPTTLSDDLLESLQQVVEVVLQARGSLQIMSSQLDTAVARVQDVLNVREQVGDSVETERTEARKGRGVLEEEAVEQEWDDAENAESAEELLEEDEYVPVKAQRPQKKKRSNKEKKVKSRMF